MRLDFEPAGRSLSLEGAEGWRDRFHAIWLRDSCSCRQCRRPETNERLLDSTGIDHDLTIVDAAVRNGRLQLEFSDGHRTELASDFLAQHAPSRWDKAENPLVGRRGRSDGRDGLGSSPASLPASFQRQDLEERAGLGHFVDALWVDGAALVRSVEPTEAGLLGVAGLIGHVLPSNYGRTWTVEATVDPYSAVDSELGLKVHTDLPYRQSPPGLQLILAVIADVEGGASTLVDGFTMAERLRAENRRWWQLLTSVPFAYSFRRPGTHLERASPLLSLESDGRYQQVRRAPDLVGSPVVQADDVPELYEALARWSHLLDDPENQVEVRLESGDVLAFDNHRMLHGRSAFELGSTGRRLLRGCYLDIDELTNRRALLADRG